MRKLPIIIYGTISLIYLGFTFQTYGISIESFVLLAPLAAISVLMWSEAIQYMFFHMSTVNVEGFRPEPPIAFRMLGWVLFLTIIPLIIWNVSRGA